MREINVSREIEAPQSAVWAVLADFPNIADWNSGVKVSHSTSDSSEGVGATRHCDLAPVGALEETITEWSPEEKMVVRIDSAAKLPIRSGLVTFTLDGTEATTTTDLAYSYEARFGPLGSVMGPLIDRQLRKGFEGFLADLEAAARGRNG
jgi:uncharacterized protein YndB with AHSA1/START domain